MFQVLNDPKTLEVSVPCDCHTEKIVISCFGDDRDWYYVSFYVDSFYAAQSLLSVFMDRLKMAWKALRKGNYIHQEITLSREKLVELRDGLNRLLEE